MLYAVLSVVLSVAATFAGVMAGDILLARRAS
jgi:hypothetical protein